MSTVRKETSPIKTAVDRVRTLAYGSFALATLALTNPGGSPEQKATPPIVSAPSSDQLIAALIGADRFLGNMYKEIDAGNSTMSEYPGFPLRVHQDSYNQWQLAGQDGTAVLNSLNDRESESFDVDFSTPNAKHSPLVHVDVNWNYSPTTFQAVVSNDAFIDDKTDGEVYLLDKPIATFNHDNVGQNVVLELDKLDARQLQSFRYTIRHGNQSEQNRQWYQGNFDKYQKLRSFQEHWGFLTDFDIHSPIWGQGTEFGINMPFTASGNEGNAYNDCTINLPSGVTSYQYRSKVCRAPGLYTELSRSDTLVSTAQTLLVLNKYGDPKYSQNGIKSPEEIANDLERKWNKTGVGIGMSTPLFYLEDPASAIRTAQFGALEAELGYRYNQPSRIAYADAVALNFLKLQIKDDGIIRSSSGNEYYRPAQIGGFYPSWDKSFRSAQLEKRALYNLLVDSSFNMLPEYPGIISTNTETNEDVVAFLRKYLCLKYQIDCPPTLAKLPVGSEALMAMITAEQKAAKSSPVVLAQQPLLGNKQGLPLPNISRVVFDDWLLDDRMGWPDNPNSTAWFKDKTYHISPKKPNEFVAINAQIPEPLEDVVVTATFRKVGGPPGGGYGVILRDNGKPDSLDGVNQSGRYYVMGVGDQRDVGIWRREEDHWVDLLPWTHSEVVGPASGPNEIKVLAEGDKFTLIVNNRFVTSIVDPVLTRGGVGIFTGGDGNEVALDRFQVQALK